MTGVGVPGFERDEVEDDGEIQFIGSRPALADMEMSGGEDRSARLLLLHYHVFKNAGSSFDETLRQSFEGNWTEREFTPSAKASNVAEIEAFLAGHPHLQALSSHTALLPLPQVEGVEIFPVFFVRHPILRLQSAYRFESRQNADTFGSRLARRTDFAGYVQGLFEVGNNRQVRDFHAHRLAFGDSAGATEAERAFRTLRSLPFVGLVEAYDESLRRLEALLRSRLPQFRPAFVRKNVTSVRDDLSMSEQLAEIRAELGDDLYLRVEANNLTDLRIFEMVAARYAVEPPPASI